ncbi:hypothetical protein B0H10DRAFT_2131789 [Mycena sp. CBHHK59/15]|nr:hypothetical protein B0H10DRAFT_2131789 [Mycena sp. CBHHK59/15]
MSSTSSASSKSAGLVVLCRLRHVCPQYEDHRHLLKDVSRDISLPEILGTKDGIAALAKFLEESGAFTKTGTPHRPLEIPLCDNEPDPLESDDEFDDGG